MRVISKDLLEGVVKLGLAASVIFIWRGIFRKKVQKKATLNASNPASSSSANRPRIPSEGNYMPHEHESKMAERVRQNSFNDLESLERSRVVVRVPATSANMGPGYDTIGMAIDMWSEFTIERSDTFEIVCEGEGSHDMPLDDSNLVRANPNPDPNPNPNPNSKPKPKPKPNPNPDPNPNSNDKKICVGIRAAFQVANRPVPTLKYRLVNRIPYARGLGSSSAAIVGGLIGGLVLAGHKVPAWGQEELLQMACKIEGHPDNVAPAIYGGIQLGIYDETRHRWATERVNLPPGIQCVCFIPKVVGKTSTARGVLPNKVPRADAVYNIGRVAWLINALSSNNLDQLRIGCMDALHQPQRARAVYPHLAPLITAAIEAGACTAYLSGAGPTVMALTSGASGDIFTQRDKERVDRKVAEAMIEAAKCTKTDGEVFITSASGVGAQVVSAVPPFSKGLVQYSAGV